MKILPVILVLVASSANAASGAGSWQILDQFQDLQPSTGAPNGFAEDSAGRIWAAGQETAPSNTGVLRMSADRGASWNTVGTFPRFSSNLSVVAADKKGNIFAGGPALIADSNNEIDSLIEESSDAGQTWRTVGQAIFGYRTVEALATDSAGRIFASSVESSDGNFQEIEMTADGGATWSVVDTINPQNNLILRAGIAVDSSDTVFTLISVDNSLVIRKSKDHGATWAAAFSQANAVGNSIGIDPSGVIYVAGTTTNSPSTSFLLKSKDGGATFQSVTTDAFTSLAIGTTPGMLYASTQFKIETSTDAGTTWSTVDQLGPDTSFGWLAGHVDSLGNVYFGAYGPDAQGNAWYVSRSSDHGVTWTTSDLFSTPAPTQSSASQVASDGKGHLLAVGSGNNLSEWLVRVSSDDGKSWTQVDMQGASSGMYPTSAAFDPTGAMYVMGSFNGDGNQVLRKSADGGRSWTQLESQSGISPIFLRIGASGIYTVGADSSGAYYLRRSSDFGKTWNQSLMFASGADQLTLYDFTVDSAGDFYAVGSRQIASGNTRATVMESTDGGNTWTEAAYFAGNTQAQAAGVALDAKGNVWVLGVIDSSPILIQSDDLGRTWTSPTPVLFGATNVNFYLTTRGSELVVGSGNGETVVSDDAGQSWRQVAAPAPNFSGQLSSDIAGNLFMAGIITSGSNHFATWTVEKLETTSR